MARFVDSVDQCFPVKGQKKPLCWHILRRRYSNKCGVFMQADLPKKF